MLRPSWPTAVVALVVTVATAWAARDFARPAQIDVSSAPITRGPIVRTIVATGTLQPVATVEVGAQISGTIAALHADYNSIVHKGDVIAELDPSQLDAELAVAEAECAEAQAALDQATAAHGGLETADLDARTRLNREAALAARALVPAADLDAARNAAQQADADLQSGESQIAVARAGVEQARAQLDQARENRARAVITSPIDGIVVSRNVDVGQTVAATVQAPVLFEIASDFSRMQVEVDVDETDIGGVEIGTAADFQVESYPDHFVGTVTQLRLQPVAEQTTTATTAGSPTPTATVVASVIGYATIIDVANPDGRLRPGMTATVTLRGTRVDHVLRIPNAALSFRPPDDVLKSIGQRTPAPATTARAANDPPLRRVWQFDGAQFTPVDIDTGITDGVWTQALDASALREGELLVTRAAIGDYSTRR